MNSNKFTRMMSSRDIAIILISALLMGAAAVIQYFYMRYSIVAAATQSAKSDLTLSCQQIETEVTAIESAVDMMGYAVLAQKDQPEDMYDITLRILEECPSVESCVVAFRKGFYADKGLDSLYAPQMVRLGESFDRRKVRDYLEEDWYRDPATYRKSQWSEPYAERGGLVLVTYSYPVTDAQGRLIAVLTANVPTDSLTKAIDGVEGYPSSYAVLTSTGGHRLLGVNAEVPSDDDALVFSSTIGRVGWKLTTVCPETDIRQKTITARAIVLSMQILAMALLILIVVSSMLNVRRLRRTTRERLRMGRELEKAAGVQEAMQNAVAGSLPKNEHIACTARMINAREIGGDFYDCFIHDDRLYFSIGDVSGTGAPAALLMAMAKSAFRVSARHQENPAGIMAEVNRLICKMNDGRTTIKMLGGTLELSTGRITYCNAGMHPQVVIAAKENSPLPVAPNPRIGASADSRFEEQQADIERGSTLFLYTDGLTEAVNKRGAEWGLKHLNTQLSASRRTDTEALLNQIEKVITEYTSGATLPDDITMLGITYKG